MPTKREVVRSMITGEPVAGKDASEALFDVPPLVGDVGAGPLDADWKRAADELRARFHAAPHAELSYYRLFFDIPDLTVEQLDALLESMRLAIEQPEDFYDGVRGQEALFGEVGEAAGCVWKIPKYFPTRAASKDQVSRIAALRDKYRLDPGIDINPNDHTFEFCDPRWWPLLLEKGEEWVGRWPKGLAAYRMHDQNHSYVYTSKSGLARPVKIALLADFGTGSYHSRCIAKQLAAHKYPYVFHLGDVYYGGTQAEFDRFYSAPLDEVMNVSRLFSLPENHELYGEGRAYLAFLDRERLNGRIDQEGSYFCVRFPEHQLVGVDVNWNGRQKFRHPPSQAWLTRVLRDGKDRTTILLTGSGPFMYGDAKNRGLLEDMSVWTEQGHVHMWLWGDTHYCALFQRDPDKANFVGACIGHGGYPGGVQKNGRKSFVPTRWVETEARFPAETGLRQDVGNNGWVEMTLLEGGGVELCFVDWLGCKRFRIRYTREKDFLAFHLVEQGKSDEFGRDTLHEA